MTRRKTKTLVDVKLDMSELYEGVKSGEVDMKLASELANITGKFLKAASLELANDIFRHNLPRQIEGRATDA